MSTGFATRIRYFAVSAGLMGVICALINFHPSIVALAKDPMVGGAPMYASKSIVENAVNSKDHTTLVAAVKAAGLVDTLAGPGPFTVFAPTNEAFKKLPAGTVDNLLKPENKGLLLAVLTYHVVPGNITANDLIDKIKAGRGKAVLKTVEGETLTAVKNGAKIELLSSNGGISTLIGPSIRQSNGYIQVVDNVLLPAASDATSYATVNTIESFFPWPPPQPSASYQFSRSTVIGRSEKLSLYRMSEILDKTLDAQGYADRQYFLQFSGEGFVTITRMERIEEDGASATLKRWDTSVKMTGKFDLRQYLDALSGRLRGHFRVFAFVVSKDHTLSSPKPMTMELLNEWKSRGVRTLPLNFRRIPFTEDYSIYVLIYEFERKQDKAPEFIASDNSILSGKQHVQGAGLSEMVK